MVKSRFAALCLALLCVFTTGCGDTSAPKTLQVVNLKVEGRESPLAVDVAMPRFSWQLASDQQGVLQQAYQIVVTQGENVVWDSGKVASGQAIHVPYDGTSLQPEQEYQWRLLVNTNVGDASAQGRFGTGMMMAPGEVDGWAGAQWIGGGARDLPFYSHALPVFHIEYTVQLSQQHNSESASFVLGANDARLQDASQNIYRIASGHNESYLALTLDIAPLKQGHPAQLHVYRVGYHPADVADTPLASLDIPVEAINSTNAYQPHHFVVRSNVSRLDIAITKDEQQWHLAEQLVVNPVGNSHDFIAFPQLADIGFKAETGQVATFSQVRIKHYRAPQSTLFEERGDSSIFSDVEGVTYSAGKYQLNGERAVMATADPSRNAMPMLRHTFTAPQGELESARLYATARGVYDIFLNGQRLGEQRFAPGLTQYNATHEYQTYDLTELLKSGSENVLAAQLAEGWWSGAITFHTNLWNFFGDRQSLLAKLVLRYRDGREQVITTQPDTWQFFSQGPLRASSIFQGEVYDAQIASKMAGWNDVGYNASAWQAAQVVAAQDIAPYVEPFPWSGRTFAFDYEQLQFIAQPDEGVGVAAEVTAQSVVQVAPGVFIYDFGQNMAGVPMVDVEGAAGQRVQMRFAEVLYPDRPEHPGLAGSMMMENIRAAMAQDTFVLAGGREVLQPRFTYHGFRYMEIKGLQEALPLEQVKALSLSSVTSLAASFNSSNANVNKLWQNISWSLRSNFFSIPTDTPARNERMGWGGDINVFARTSLWLADAGNFLSRHMTALRNTQQTDGRFPDVAPVVGGFGGALWGTAGTVIPWEVYQQTGDRRILQDNFEAMARYVDYLTGRIDPVTNILDEGPLGDWLSPEGSKNDDTLFWEAYYLHSLRILADSAAILQDAVSEQKYRELFHARLAHYQKVYFDEDGLSRSSGFAGIMFGQKDPALKQVGTPIDSQASYAVPLALSLLQGDLQSKAQQRLLAAVARSNVDDLGQLRPAYSLMTGFIGTAVLLPSLSEAGQDAAAYKLLQQEDYPSWLYPVKNGATTIWERLNSYTHKEGFGGNNSMNSFNHYAFGAVGEWLYRYSLGIRPIEPGFKRFTLQPTPDPTGKMQFASGHFDSPYGRIASRWEVVADATQYEFTVPANTTAQVVLQGIAARTTIDGRSLSEAGVAFEQVAEDMINVSLGSGVYRIEVASQQY